MKYYLFLLFIFFSNILTCQEEIEKLDFLFPGDSIPTNTFVLDEVTVFQPLKFKNDELSLTQMVRNYTFFRISNQ